jgi:holo-ACP synthase
MELKAILKARGLRWEERKLLVSQYRCPVLTVRLNIPGPDKNLPGAMEVLTILREKFLTYPPMNEPHLVPAQQWGFGEDGPHWHAVGRISGINLKYLAVRLEAEKPYGRLVDADVLDVNSEPISRTQLGMAPRTCFLCPEPAVECVRLKRHDPAELMAHVRKLLDLAILGQTI